MPAIFVILALVSSAVPVRARDEPTLACRVVAVEDSSSLRVVCGDRPGRLRLPGLRAPQPGPPQLGGEPFAEESQRHVQELLLGRTVRLDGSGSGGPPRVLLDGEELSQLLVRCGWAFARPSQGPFGDTLQQAERSARAEGLGVWSLDAWTSLRDQATVPVLLPAPSASPPEPSLGEHARALTDKTWAERKAAFEQALAELETLEEED
jgi:endonuclease YncB( thermonuclease family)